MKFLVMFCILSVLVISGCTGTQKGAGLGGLVGAGAGAIIGHQSGHAKEGALIGAAAGAAGGALIGDQMDTKFCPVCGKAYTSGVQFCSKDGTELKFKQK